MLRVAAKKRIRGGARDVIGPNPSEEPFPIPLDGATDAIAAPSLRGVRRRLANKAAVGLGVTALLLAVALLALGWWYRRREARMASTERASRNRSALPQASAEQARGLPSQLSPIAESPMSNDTDDDERRKSALSYEDTLGPPGDDPAALGVNRNLSKKYDWVQDEEDGGDDRRGGNDRASSRTMGGSADRSIGDDGGDSYGFRGDGRGGGGSTHWDGGGSGADGRGRSHADMYSLHSAQQMDDMTDVEEQLAGNKEALRIGVVDADTDSSCGTRESDRRQEEDSEDDDFLFSNRSQTSSFDKVFESQTVAGRSNDMGVTGRGSPENISPSPSSRHQSSAGSDQYGDRNHVRDNGDDVGRQAWDGTIGQDLKSAIAGETTLTEALGLKNFSPPTAECTSASSSSQAHTFHEDGFDIASMSTDARRWDDQASTLPDESNAGDWEEEARERMELARTKAAGGGAAGDGGNAYGTRSMAQYT